MSSLPLCEAGEFRRGFATANKWELLVSEIRRKLNFNCNPERGPISLPSRTFCYQSKVASASLLLCCLGAQSEPQIAAGKATSGTAGNSRTRAKKLYRGKKLLYQLAGNGSAQNEPRRGEGTS
jgi:hypothetical protein